MTHDFIIVGGGSAGSVLANRLSAKSGTQVLLLEAGQDTPHGKIPPEVLDSYPGTAYFDPRFHWTQLKVRTEVVSHNNPAESPPPLRKYEQARILGGGSSINGQLANRGAPADFEEWVARGARGWATQAGFTPRKCTKLRLSSMPRRPGRSSPRQGRRCRRRCGHLVGHSPPPWAKIEGVRRE